MTHGSYHKPVLDDWGASSGVGATRVAGPRLERACLLSKVYAARKPSAPAGKRLRSRTQADRPLGSALGPT